MKESLLPSSGWKLADNLVGSFETTLTANFELQALHTFHRNFQLARLASLADLEATLHSQSASGALAFA